MHGNCTRNEEEKNKCEPTPEPGNRFVAMSQDIRGIKEILQEGFDIEKQIKDLIEK